MNLVEMQELARELQPLVTSLKMGDDGLEAEGDAENRLKIEQIISAKLGQPTGSTPNLKRRLREHQSGFCLATRKHRPVRLIWLCAFPGRLSARRFEKYLKTGSGQAFRNRRLTKR